ncbi:hypothetical protein BS47DRAFT_1113870 [Hydnum rufescens UP504]|uniref:Uncharacterized protein n=1 Tax=Hydnum rufescens UP504 TaxID=1448309 RepID=A0A9P6AUE7_9AGAM|nr:hypothetical protein BS47DRAFT_1113870 [Hydnum rufescens UP504]
MGKNLPSIQHHTCHFSIARRPGAVRDRWVGFTLCRLTSRTKWWEVRKTFSLMNQREKDVWSRGIDETYLLTVLHPHHVRCPGMRPIEECTRRQPSCLGPTVDGTPGLVRRDSNHSCWDANETVEPLTDRFSLHTHPDPSSSSRSGTVDGRIPKVSLLFACNTSGLDFEW